MTIGETERLENLQLSGLRIICGAKVGTSHQPLYSEVKLEKLSERRKKARIIKFWEILKTEKTCQLNRNMVPTVEERNTRARRRLRDFTLIKCNTSQYQNSFLPRVITEWNTQPLTHRNVDTKDQLKLLLTGRKELVFQWEEEVTRHSSIMLARIRCDNPDLNANLFGRCMAESPACVCGVAMETSEHYLLKCPNFTQQRNKIINSSIDYTLILIL